MSETQQETVVWTLPSLYAWMHEHLSVGHRLSVRTPEDSDHNAGVFACSCGVALDVRPVAASDPTSGLFAVSGPGLPTGPAHRARDCTNHVALTVDRQAQRVVLAFGDPATQISLTRDAAQGLAATLILEARSLENPDR